MHWITPEPVVPVSGLRRPTAYGDENEVDGFTTVGKGGKVMQFTPEGIFNNLQSIQDARGKKVCPVLSICLPFCLSYVQNTDGGEQIRIFEKLLDVAVTVYQRIRVLLALISSRFDYNSSIASHMPVELWLSAQREVDQLVSIVASNASYSAQEATDDYDESVERTPATEGGVVRIRGSIHELH